MKEDFLWGILHYPQTEHAPQVECTLHMYSTSCITVLLLSFDSYFYVALSKPTLPLLDIIV